MLAALARLEARSRTRHCDDDDDHDEDDESDDADARAGARTALQGAPARAAAEDRRAGRGGAGLIGGPARRGGASKAATRLTPNRDCLGS